MQRAEDCLDTLEKVKGEITARSEAWERQQQDTTTSLAIVAGTPSIPARTSSSLQSLMAAAEAKYRQEPGPTSATNSIQPANLLNILSQTNLLVLVLDVRPMQEYSQGHILWPSLLVDDANKKKHQGIIQIEPQWLALPRYSFSFFLIHNT